MATASMHGTGSWAARPVLRFLGDRAAGWRTGSTRSQVLALVLLLIGVAVSFGVNLHDHALVPLTAYVVWLLVGMLLLRLRPLLVLAVFVTAAGFAAVVRDDPLTSAKVTAGLALLAAVLLVLYHSSRQRSGLPGSLGEAMLVDLRDRLQSQGTVPPLPLGWHCQSAMLPANGGDYAGDFLVADLTEDEHHLEMVLVDVCGKGVAAAAQALQFAGALGGLIGALPPLALVAAANDFLLRQFADDSFATAVHVVIDLRTGRYSVVSAGHPPALRWTLPQGEWVVDNARGTALGITRTPEFHTSHGVLEAGEALMFYTDGVIESRHADLDEGIAWLRTTGRAAVARGFDGVASRIVSQVERGDDDRAVLVLSRSPESA